MRHSLIILLSLYIPLYASAQFNSFAPIGATWYYTHDWFYGNNNVDYTRIQSVGDTLIQGRLCSIVYIENAYQNASEFPDSLYLFSDSGKVYRYFDEFNTWGLQYDFTAEAGDTIVIYGSVYSSIIDSFKVVVDSIGYIIINDITLKTLFYNESSGPWEYIQEVIEGVGGTSFLFPTYTLAENTNHGLRCYFDEGIGPYNSGLVETCDTIINWIQNVAGSLSYSISPTLFEDEITVTNQNTKSFILKIVDQNMSLVGEYYLSPHEVVTLELNSIPSGIYFALVSDGTFIGLNKIIKISP